MYGFLGAKNLESVFINNEVPSIIRKLKIVQQIVLKIKIMVVKMLITIFLSYNLAFFLPQLLTKTLIIIISV